MGFTPVTNPRLVIVVTINRTAGDGGMGAAAAAPVFKTIATEALRMLDVPKDIPEEIADAKKPAKGEAAWKTMSPLPISAAPASWKKTPACRKLVAEQMKPAAGPG